MNIKDWVVGQTVVIHRLDGEQETTLVKNVGRKLVTVSLDGYSNELQFDTTFDPPEHRDSVTGNLYIMYTPMQSDEVNYVKLVIRRIRLAAYGYSPYNKKGLPLPLKLLLQIGDTLGVLRPNHLQSKDTNSNADKIQTTDVDNIANPRYVRRTRNR